MTPEQENTGTWLDEVKELIRRKQAENVALRKIQDSLESGIGLTDFSGQIPLDEDNEENTADENQ